MFKQYCVLVGISHFTGAESVSVSTKPHEEIQPGPKRKYTLLSLGRVLKTEGAHEKYGCATPTIKLIQKE